MKLAAVLLFPVLAFGQQTELNSSYLSSYSPVTAKQRLRWVLDSTLDPANLLGHAFSAGISTGTDSPHELGTHWSGFEKRYFNDVTTSVLDHSIEAGVGSLWGEDPRYVRAAPGTSLKGRIFHAAAWTFLARNRNGDTRPAYARFIAIPAGNALSDTWRPPSEGGVDDLLSRTALGFAGQLAGNEFHELWPDVKKILPH
jgi:hypothetical protein